MKMIWKNLTQHSSIWLAIAFYTICGLLLLLWPTFALNIASYAIATLLLIVSAICIISYMRSSTLQAVLGAQLTVGLILLCLSIFLFVNPLIISALLPFVWGFSLLIGGFGKIQLCIDMKRIGGKNWWALLIAAVVSFVLGFLAITQPVFITQIIVQFIGISLLIEAILDIVAHFVVNRRIKEYRKTIEI
ncbi:MAG: hypothetical protein GX096_10880 [Clostridiales bacterium]|nr:hypothetical protein [Clostridiales bacterium]